MEFKNDFMRAIYEADKAHRDSVKVEVFGDTAEVFFNQYAIDDEHQDSLWYGGRVVEILFKGYRFILGAYGDICASLLDENNEEVAYLKDKNNSGAFYTEMSYYIKNDKELFDLENEGRLVLENNNWFEVLVDAPDGERIDTGWVTSDYSYYDGIEETICGMQDFINDNC